MASTRTITSEYSSKYRAPAAITPSQITAITIAAITITAVTVTAIAVASLAYITVACITVAPLAQVAMASVTGAAMAMAVLAPPHAQFQESAAAAWVVVGAAAVAYRLHIIRGARCAHTIVALHLPLL